MIEEDNDKIKDQTQEIEEFTFELLDAYFASRSADPGNSEIGQPLTPEYKTTDDIATELDSIMPVDLHSIVIYMRHKGYRLKTAADGSLRWEIWRDMNYMG